MKSFEYEVGVEWTGNDGSGTSTPKFGRDAEISSANKPTIIGSAPREFGGDGMNWAPEDLFVAAVGQCHMLTYLYLCARAGIVVESYTDHPVGTLDVEGATVAQFRKVELRPAVVISKGDPDAAMALHEDAHNGCYVGRSVKAEVNITPTVSFVGAATQ